MESPLWADGAVRVDPAASKETVAHHVLGKQKNPDRQDDYKQPADNTELGWPSPCAISYWHLAGAWLAVLRIPRL